MTTFGSIQPAEFAEPAAFYNLAETAARCICGATITLRTDGDWRHYGGRLYCAPLREATS